MYEDYVRGRNQLGLRFKKHRTKKAFLEAASNPLHAFCQACKDNQKAGNPHLPAPAKALLEVAGVLLIVCYGLKPWRAISWLAMAALAQTASENDSSVGPWDHYDPNEDQPPSNSNGHNDGNPLD